MMASPLPDTPNSPPKEEEPRAALVYGESAKRSFVKALAWRLTAGVVTLVRYDKKTITFFIFMHSFLTAREGWGWGWGQEGGSILRGAFVVMVGSPLVVFIGGGGSGGL